MLAIALVPPHYSLPHPSLFPSYSPTPPPSPPPPSTPEQCRVANATSTDDLKHRRFCTRLRTNNTRQDEVCINSFFFFQYCGQTWPEGKIWILENVCKCIHKRSLHLLAYCTCFLVLEVHFFVQWMMDPCFFSQESSKQCGGSVWNLRIVVDPTKTKAEMYHS